MTAKTASSKIILAILIIGLFLRLYKLGARSIWFDEAGIVVAEKYLSLFGPTMNAWIKSRGVTFIYFALLVPWYKIAGSEFILRLPQVLFGVLTVLMLFKLGKLLFDRKTGLLAAFLLAMSPFHIYYSQELSPYSLTALLSVTSVYFLERYLMEDNPQFLLWTAGVSLVAVYIHLSVILLLFSETIFLLIYYRRQYALIKKWGLMILTMSFFLLPVVIFFAPRLMEIALCSGGLVWLKLDLSFKNILYTFKNFSAGYNTVPYIYIPATLLFLGLCMAAWRQFSKNIMLLSICVFFPVLVIFLVSHFRLCYVDRYFIAGLPFYSLITAVGISRSGRFAGVICMVIAALTFTALKNYYADYLPGSFAEHIGVESRKDFRAAAGYIINKMEPGTVVLHTCDNTTLPFDYYFKRQSACPTDNNLLLRFTAQDELGVFRYSLEDEQSLLPLHIKPEYFGSFWLVVSEWSARRNKSEENEIVQQLKDRFILREYRQFKGVDIYLLTQIATNPLPNYHE